MRHNRLTGRVAGNLPGQQINELQPRSVAIHESPWPNRARRRHENPLRFRNGVRVNYLVFIPKERQFPAMNVPYHKPEEAA